MGTTVTSKGHIPKPIRDSAEVVPDAKFDFVVNGQGRIEIVKENGEPLTERELAFQSAIGSADIKWDVDELMAMLRGND